MRIATWGSNQMYLSRLMDIQTRMNEAQNQIATQKKATQYSGISSETARLINLENDKSLYDQFIRNNEYADTKLEAASNAVDSVRTAITQFRDKLRAFNDGNTKDRQNVEQVQDFAFRSMLDIQSALSTSVDGAYLFSGGRLSKAPINLPASTLSAFQAKYDGRSVTFPTTRDGNLFDARLTAAEAGALNFDAANGVVVPANARAYADIPLGAMINFSGTASNDGSFTVRGRVVTNSSGGALTETADAGATAFLTHSGGVIDNAATGALAFSFDRQGRMVVTPTTAGSLSALTAGTKFTVTGSTGGAYDGGFKVVSANADGTITIENDGDLAQDETVDTAGLTLGTHTDADGVPDGTAALGAGNATFTLSGSTVTLSVPSGGADLSTAYNVGDMITITGSGGHNGTFTVTASTTNSVSFDINPAAIRTAQFLPQTGRTDVLMSFLDPATTDGSTVTLNSGDYTSLAFDPSGESITAAAGSLVDATGNASPPVGTLITLASASGVNDGIYEVVSNDTTTITIRSHTLANEPVAGSAVLSAESWYKGDTLELQHSVAADRTVTTGIFASDPAFEKALRAMAIVAQGSFGTAGGLDQNPDRAQAAFFLLQDALESPANGTPPYGEEQVGDITALQADIGFTRGIITSKNDQFKNMINQYQTRIDGIENIDLTEAITRMLAEQNAMQASYQTLAQLRQMTLLNYLK